MSAGEWNVPGAPYLRSEQVCGVRRKAIAASCAPTTIAIPAHAATTGDAPSATILLKGWAWWLTGSVGLLSDAIESFVNLAGAMMALAMLTLAAMPADEN